MSEQKDVPYIVYEGTLSRAERTSKRLLAVILVLLMLWFSTIISFIWYITLPVEEVTDTQTIEDVDCSTVTQSIGGVYGEDKAD